MNRVRPLISPAKVIKFCLSLLSTHLQTLYTDLDPVKDFKVDAQSRKHYQTINHRKLGQRGGGNGEQGSLFKKNLLLPQPSLPLSAALHAGHQRPLGLPSLQD